MKKELSTAAKRPLEIKRGNVTGKIYAGQDRVHGIATRNIPSPSTTAQRKKRDLAKARRGTEFTADNLAMLKK